MSTSTTLACFSILAISPLLQGQAPPTAYTITEAVAGAPAGSAMTVYRNGMNVLTEMKYPAQPGEPAHRTLTFYDLQAHTSHSWDPAITPSSCSAGTFSGDWGDPFETTTQLTAAIAKGDLKPAGTETLHGIPTRVYAGASQGMSLKAWLDEKDHLVIRAEFGAPGGPMQTMVDITRVSLTPPTPSLIVMPAYCGSVKAPPSAAELMAAETGDSGDNFVSANYGPGSKNSCSIIIRPVAAGTMAPINRRFQVAIDTTYNQDSPTAPHYEFGVGNDGTSTFSGGGLHEITSQIHNGMLRIDNPPAYFNLSMNIVNPGNGAGIGLVYRQCFAPVTMLYYVVKDPSNPGKGGDFLYAKAGKYAAVPAH
ncbi:MAG TPA: hypothetical protein VG225_14390 [Terracidiphilus sp.]|jgi:hypothetical protein|nr:hypothetical protein [Terracidiphilus sp.]